MFMYSAESGVDGLAVLPEVDEKNSWPDEAAEDAMDCLRCVADSCGHMSMAKKLDAVEEQPADAENEWKSPSSSSIFGVVRMAAINSAMRANVCLQRESYQYVNVCIDFVSLISCNVDAGKKPTSGTNNSHVGQTPRSGRTIEFSESVSGARVEGEERQNQLM